MAVPFGGKCPNCGAAVTLVQLEATSDLVEASGSCAVCGRELHGSAWIDRQGYLMTRIRVVDPSDALTGKDSIAR